MTNRSGPTINHADANLFHVNPSPEKIERHVGPNGHPVIDRQMFLDLAQARIAAVMRNQPENTKINDIKQRLEILIPENEARLRKFVDAKNERFEAYQKYIKARAALNQDPKNAELKKSLFVAKTVYEKKNERYNKKFDKLFKEYLKGVQRVSYLLSKYSKPKLSRKEIEALYQDALLREKRPIQENHYQVQNHAGTSTVAVFSRQSPDQFITNKQRALMPDDMRNRTDVTLPSTIRDERQFSNVNALRTEVGINGRVVFTGHRHGSPCPLNISDRSERQFRTLLNVRQAMGIAIQEKLEKIKAGDPERYNRIIKGEETLELDHYALSILSPVANSNRVDSGMKQYRQVSDSRLAYWALDGRTINDFEIPGIDNSQKLIKVKPNITFMSAGVNAARGIESLEAKWMVRNTNRRGFNHLADNFRKSLDDNEPVAKALDEIEGDKNVKAKREALDSGLKKYSGQLHACYQRYEANLERLHNLEQRSALQKIKSGSNRDIQLLKYDLKQDLKDIKQYEAQINKLHKDFYRARKPLLLKKIKSLRQEIKDMPDGEAKIKQQMFVDLTAIALKSKPGLGRFLKVKMLGIMKGLVRSANGKDKIQDLIDSLNKDNYQFQARFVMLAQHMDAFVEWFCKSGEDRTGLLNEQVTAFCAFIAENKRAPDWSNKQDRERFHDLVHQDHQCSPHRENNQRNDGGRGLKVSNGDFHSGVGDYHTDKKMAEVLKKSKLKSSIMKPFQRYKAKQLKKDAEAILQQPSRVSEAKVVQHEDPVTIRAQPFIPQVLHDEQRQRVERRLADIKSFQGTPEVIDCVKALQADIDKMGPNNVVPKVLPNYIAQNLNHDGLTKVKTRLNQVLQDLKQAKSAEEVNNIYKNNQSLWATSSEHPIKKLLDAIEPKSSPSMLKNSN